MQLSHERVDQIAAWMALDVAGADPAVHLSAAHRPTPEELAAIIFDLRRAHQLLEQCRHCGWRDPHHADAEALSRHEAQCPLNPQVAQCARLEALLERAIALHDTAWRDGWDGNDPAWWSKRLPPDATADEGREWCLAHASDSADERDAIRADFQALLAGTDADSLDRLAREIAAWQAVAFPGATIEAKVAKLTDEVGELVKAPTDADELADCLMLVIGVAAKAHVDLVAAVRRKLTVNQGRIWGAPDARGVVRHVAPTPAAPQS